MAKNLQTERRLELQIARRQRREAFEAKAAARRTAMVAGLSKIPLEERARRVEYWDDSGAGACASDDVSSESDYVRYRPRSKETVIESSPATIAYLTAVLGHPPTPLDGEWTPVHDNFREPGKWHKTTLRLAHQRANGFYHEPSCAYCSSGFPVLHCSTPRCSQGCCQHCWSFGFYGTPEFARIFTYFAHTACITHSVRVTLSGTTFTDGSGKKFTTEERWSWRCRSCTAGSGAIWKPPVLTLFMVTSCIASSDLGKARFEADVIQPVTDESLGRTLGSQLFLSYIHNVKSYRCR